MADTANTLAGEIANCVDSRISLALATAASLPSSVILGKNMPSLSIGSWTKSGTTYSTTISYDGDGELTTTLGTISNGTLSITDADGIFSGTISASEGDNYAASSLTFNYNTEQIPAVAKTTPSLSLGSWNKNNTTYSATVTYNGDGTVKTSLGEITTELVDDLTIVQVIEPPEGISGVVVYATETDNFAPAVAKFTTS